MEKERRGKAGTIIAILILLIGAGIVFYMVFLPKLEDAQMKNQWEGLDLLEKYKENPDMVGWLQVEGTNINYPVMNGDSYLYRNFEKESDPSGSLFVEDGWEEDSICSLIYGHNMWMYGTMFNHLHKFEKKKFFDKHHEIKFYVIKDKGKTAEKRTYKIECCVQADIKEWYYQDCQYMKTYEEIFAFEDECKKRALLKRDVGIDEAYEPENFIVLSTCSYHIPGRRKDGRLLVTGKMIDKVEQTKLDPFGKENKKLN